HGCLANHCAGSKSAIPRLLTWAPTKTYSLPRLELPMRKTLLAASALALAIAAPLAHAHKAGDIIVRAGAVTVDPREDSSLLNLDGGSVPGTGATLNSDTQLGLNFAYMLTEDRKS